MHGLPSAIRILVNREKVRTNVATSSEDSRGILEARLSESRANAPSPSFVRFGTKYRLESITLSRGAFLILGACSEPGAAPQPLQAPGSSAYKSAMARKTLYASDDRTADDPQSMSELMRSRSRIE